MVRFRDKSSMNCKSRHRKAGSATTSARCRAEEGQKLPSPRGCPQRPWLRRRLDICRYRQVCAEQCLHPNRYTSVASRAAAKRRFRRQTAHAGKTPTRHPAPISAPTCSFLVAPSGQVPSRMMAIRQLVKGADSSSNGSSSALPHSGAPNQAKGN